MRLSGKADAIKYTDRSMDEGLNVSFYLAVDRNNQGFFMGVLPLANAVLLPVSR